MKKMPKIWNPLLSLYKQRIIINLLPSYIKKKVLNNTISVVSISLEFFCNKANRSAYIEVSDKKYGYACPECIADTTKIENSIDLIKLENLLKYLKENHNLLIVTFVGHGEPLELEGNRNLVIEIIKSVYKVGKSILFQAGTIIEYYRSLKPNKIEYKKYLDNLFGSEIDVLYDKKDTIGVYIIEIDS